MTGLLSKFPWFFSCRLLYNQRSTQLDNHVGLMHPPRLAVSLIMLHSKYFTSLLLGQPSRRWLGPLPQVCAGLLLLTSILAPAFAAEENSLEQFRKNIEPILVEKCYDCHGNGMEEGSVAFDGFASQEELVENPQLWWRALRMVRAGMMPPVEMTPLTAEEKQTLETWIKRSAFHGDPNNPDPGHVTLRRLNRNEYRNTIRDLIGVEYDTQNDFPQDDSGHGFDNIGSVLTVSPLLLEKYLAAARTIIGQAVPLASKMTPEKKLTGIEFLPEGADSNNEANSNNEERGPRWLSYYEPGWVSHRVKVEHPGRYQLQVNLSADEKFVDDEFDYNKCRLNFSVDGMSKLSEEFSRQGHKPYQFSYDVDWQPGEHELIFELTPLTPDEKQIRSLTIRIKEVIVRGPFGDEHGVPVPNYAKFFPREVPENIEDRRVYAHERLEKFATRAYRRPVDDETVNRLVALAEVTSSHPGNTFEAGIAEAMTAILASPRFLFREEAALAPTADSTYPFLDDYSLAARLSYFLWSTMPDEELSRLAAEGRLRENLPAQFERMFNDPRSEQFIRHFVGQWLRARDIESVVINGSEVVQRDAAPDPAAQKMRKRFRALLMKPREELTEAERKEFAEVRRRFRRQRERFERFDLDGELRRAMRRETELVFETILREDRPLTELLESDYTFLNEKLAEHYGVAGVTGDEMRLVKLPADNPRGGILTQGTVLAVTSNPDRTSPVKRGLFVLDNILGTPPPPPPPNIPLLEDAGNEQQRQSFTVREALALHREAPLCSSCHNRMDPLGLALERFNALGMWRETDHGKPIDSAGALITGEEFTDIKELKRVLVANHRQEFYRCLTEKLLTYALGRGIEYHDTETVDAIAAQLEATDGRPSALLKGIVGSAAFQKSRPLQTAIESATIDSAASDASTTKTASAAHATSAGRP